MKKVNLYVNFLKSDVSSDFDSIRNSLRYDFSKNNELLKERAYEYDKTHEDISNEAILKFKNLRSELTNLNQRNEDTSNELVQLEKNILNMDNLLDEASGKHSKIIMEFKEMSKELEELINDKSKSSAVNNKTFTTYENAISWYQTYLNCYIKVEENEDSLQFYFDYCAEFNSGPKLTISGLKSFNFKLIQVEPEFDGWQRYAEKLEKDKCIVACVATIKQHYKSLGII